MAIRSGKSYWLGIDVAKRSFDVSLAYEGYDPREWRSLPVIHVNYPPGSKEGCRVLMEWLQRLALQGECGGICVESTGSHSLRCARVLAQENLPPVSVVNPKYVKDYGGSLGMKSKTDRVDAALLSLYGIHFHPDPLVLLSDEEQTLKDLNRIRESIVRDVVRWKNRLPEAISSSATAAIRKLQKVCMEECQHIERQLDELVESVPDLRDQRTTLQQIHGYGRVTAHTLTAERGLLVSYNRNELVASIGVYPVCHESGSTVRVPPHLAKGGGGRLRRVLYMGALAIMHHPRCYEPFITRLRNKGKGDMSIIGALMKKMVLVAHAVMKNGGVYDESKIGTQKNEKISSPAR